MSTEKTKRVFILLSSTGTVTARAIRKLKGAGHSHASLAIEPSVDKFYSFGRRKISNPFVAGFVIESIHTGIFGKYPESKSALYSLEVTEEAYQAISDTINNFIDNYESSKYSFIGMFTLGFGIKTKLKKRFTCSQFVANTLKEANALSLPKDPSLMLPKDFSGISELRLIYEGSLKNCNYNKLYQNATV